MDFMCFFASYETKNFKCSIPDIPMPRTKNETRRIVYSTESGRICPDCGYPVDDCLCRKPSRNNPDVIIKDGGVRVRREKKGRKGKTVTTISGIHLDGGSLRELASKLKQRLGTGGSVKAGTIEIQGDHCETLLKELTKMGYSAKRSGG